MSFIILKNKFEEWYEHPHNIVGENLLSKGSVKNVWAYLVSEADKFKKYETQVNAVGHSFQVKGLRGFQDRWISIPLSMVRYPGAEFQKGDKAVIKDLERFDEFKWPGIVDEMLNAQGKVRVVRDVIERPHKNALYCLQIDNRMFKFLAEWIDHAGEYIGTLEGDAPAKMKAEEKKLSVEQQLDVLNAEFQREFIKNPNIYSSGENRCAYANVGAHGGVSKHIPDICHARILQNKENEVAGIVDWVQPQLHKIEEEYENWYESEERAAAFLMKALDYWIVRSPVSYAFSTKSVPEALEKGLRYDLKAASATTIACAAIGARMFGEYPHIPYLFKEFVRDLDEDAAMFLAMVVVPSGEDKWRLYFRGCHDVFPEDFGSLSYKNNWLGQESFKKQPPYADKPTDRYWGIYGKLSSGEKGAKLDFPHRVNMTIEDLVKWFKNSDFYKEISQ